MTLETTITDRKDLDRQIASVAKEISLLDTLSHLLRRSHFHSEAIFTSMYGDMDLTSRQMALLVAIAQNPEASQKVIGDAVALDVNTVSDTLRRMERKHLVERNASASDGRSVSVRLSEQGYEVLLKAADNNMRLQNRVAARLNAEETTELKRLVRKLLGFTA